MDSQMITLSQSSSPAPCPWEVLISEVFALEQIPWKETLRNSFPSSREREFHSFYSREHGHLGTEHFFPLEHDDNLVRSAACTGGEKLSCGLNYCIILTLRLLHTGHNGSISQPSNWLIKWSKKIILAHLRQWESSCLRDWGFLWVWSRHQLACPHSIFSLPGRGHSGQGRSNSPQSL